MSLLQVEVEDFVGAARLVYDRVADPVSEALGALSATLDDCAAMAGSDPVGASWSVSYDPAATQVLQATADLVNGAYRTASLLGRSAQNYAQAEAASTAGGGSTPGVLGRLPAETTVGPRDAPSAFGGSGDPPFLWWYLQQLVHYVWPNGHQDRLHRAAAAWHACADALGEAASIVGWAAAQFVLDDLPEGDDIARVCDGLRDRMLALRSGHAGLGDACDELAYHLDDCHERIRSELDDLLEESAEIELVGGIISVVTAGAAEGPTQDVEAGRLAAAALRIGELLTTFGAAARNACRALPSIRAIAEDTRLAMENLVGARYAYPGVTQAPRIARAGGIMHSVGKAPRLSKDARAEIAATERLEDGSKLLWTSWANYPKVTRAGREYAQIGGRLYSRHAVDRLQPRGLGAPSGAVGAGRSVSPNQIAHILESARPVAVRDGRLSFTSGSVEVIMEEDIVITVITH